MSFNSQKPLFDQISKTVLDPYAIFLFDPAKTGNNGTVGTYRSLTPSDLSNPTNIYNVSGSLTVTGANAFGLTGTNNNVNVINVPAVVVTGGYIGITGNVTLANNQGFSLTGTNIVTLNNGGGVSLTGNNVITLNNGGGVSLTGNNTVFLANGGGISLTGNNTVALASNSTVGVTGNTTTSPKQYSNISNFTPSGAGATGTVFTIAANSIGFVRNLDVNPLYIKLGTGCNTGSFTDIIFGGTASGDGKGSAMTISDYLGAVSVYSSTAYYKAHTLS